MDTPAPYGTGGTSFEVDYENGISALPGQELARFQLGSTVVLVFESSDEDFEFLVKPGNRVKMGQALVRTKRPQRE
jgi:phosphatidylserine decarboxylase